MDIPGASQHAEPEKVGYLTKLSGRSFPYIPQWKRRYCVLAQGRLYYYEREDSRPGDKANGVINLEYFDHVAEAGPKDCKKATNVFVITSQDRSFFDPGRHLFSADTLPDMKDWVRRLQSALDQIRNNNRPATSTSFPAKEAAKKGKEENVENKENAQNKESTNKERKKKRKEESHRSRKSARVGVSSETQTSDPIPVTSEKEAESKMMTPPRGGVQMPGMASHLGVQLPGLSSKEAQPSVTLTANEEKTRSNGRKEDMPSAGPTLACVTKNRVKGPQGRRAPQNHRRTLAASALNKRASSLSALEYQDLNDNSEVPWMNRSLDLLEDGEVRGRGGAPDGVRPKPTVPYKAYNYSTDEDDMDDDHSDSFPTSASAMPPPPPPRSASYGLELRHNPQLRSTERHTLHSSLGDDARGSQGDLAGSKRSLGNGRMHGLAGEWHGSLGRGQNGDAMGRASPAMDDLDNMLMNQSIQHAMDSTSDVGSEGSTCRATDHQPRPQHHHHHHQQQQQGRKKSHDLSRFTTAVRHLQRHVVEIDRAVFGITGDVSCTRREVTALKEAMRALQADTDTITSTLSNLTQEAIAAQQEITFAAQSKADFVTPLKEAERVQYTVNVALREAERARQEQQKTRMEYDELVAEVRSTLKNLRDTEAARSLATAHAHSLAENTTISSSSSFSCTGSESHSSKTPSDPAHKASSEHKMGEGGQSEELPVTQSSKSGRTSTGSSSTFSSRTSARSSTGSLGGSVSGKTAQGTSTTKSTVYQSLFSKPSSIISGLTHRHSLTKSVSFADENDKEKWKKQGNSEKADSLDKKKKDEGHQRSQEKKDIKVEKSQSFLERTFRKDDKHYGSSDRKDKKDSKHYKEEKKHSTTDAGTTTDSKNTDKLDSMDRRYTSSMDRKERKGRYESKDKKGKDFENVISQLSLEDIPMADEITQEKLDFPGVSEAKEETVATTSSSSAVMKTTLNFSLGKSSSSPSVSYFGPSNRPRLLPLNPERRRSEHSTSNASSPESPIAPSPFPRSAAALPPLEESQVSEPAPLSSLHRPGSTPGPLVRQGSMTTVPEDREVEGPPTTKRPAVFALSRQNSSPNIPLQRQNSGPIIPLQRQNSLGVVPEEGRLPRQESLTSVPEERPLVDRTLPLSPSQSMTNVPMSPPFSAVPVVSESTRRAARESMELVTGPVLAGSSMQEAAATGTLPVLNLSDETDRPSATSTLKKDHKSPSEGVGILV